MVNNENPYLKHNSKLPEPPAVNNADVRDRSIQDGPIWDLSELVKMVTQGNCDNFRLVTNKAKINYEQLLENGFDLPAVLKQINPTNSFRGSFWCKTSPFKDRQGRVRGTGDWIPCDSYAVVCDYENPKTGYTGSAEYYLKMCKGLNGQTVLFVSIHL